MVRDNVSWEKYFIISKKDNFVNNVLILDLGRWQCIAARDGPKIGLSTFA